MPVADTSFVIDLIRHDPAALALLDEMEEKKDKPVMTPVTVLELYYGAYRSESMERNIREILAFRLLWEEASFSDEVYHAFGFLSADLATRGDPLGDFDEVIAAFALALDGAIITRDRHFGQVPGLTVISY